MKSEDNRNPLPREYVSSTDIKTEQERTESLELRVLEEQPSELPKVERSGVGEAVKQEHDSVEKVEAPVVTNVERANTAEVVELQSELDEVASPLADRKSGSAGSVPSIAAEHTVLKAKHFFQEQSPQMIEVAPNVLRRWSRRDVLLFGAGAIAALAGGSSLLPEATLERLGVTHENKAWPKKEWFLNRALRIDDDVAEALYSKNRLVPTYAKSQITPLKNNYNGATPDPGYIPQWDLTLEGVASGLAISLNIRTLLTRFQVHEQITRLVCVEGWTAIAWWAGLRFDDLLRAYQPMSQAKWVRVESSVNLDPSGNPDPYFVSLDLPTARHPQTLLVTHLNGQPLTVDHGAPLRLLVPTKLGLKNVKAVTKLSFVAEEPRDYWAERGYSRYDGL